MRWLARLGHGEWAVLRALPRSARSLLAASSLVAFGMPLATLFVAAFILRGGGGMAAVMRYQAALYVGIVVAFGGNVGLARRWGYARPYAAGALLIGVVLLLFTSLSSLGGPAIVAMGFLMGGAMGLYWANRNYLTLVCLRDSDRNYFIGFENMMICLSAVATPAAAGAWIAWRSESAPVASAYRGLAVMALALTVASAGVLLRERFPAAPAALRTRRRATPVWRLMLWMAALRGTVQVFLTTAPAVLIMQVMGGSERLLGIVMSSGGLLAAGALYLLGRWTAPRHRVAILAVSGLLYLAGALVNAMGQGAVFSLIFLACHLIALPMLDMGYSLFLLRAVDHATGGAAEEAYAFLFGHEVAVFAGRMIGTLGVLIVAGLTSEAAAFRHMLPLLAGVNLLCWPAAAAIARQCGTGKAQVGGQGAREGSFD